MTPLLDLTFLLLIVFMITVPLMEYSVDVSPPEMNAKPLKEKDSLSVSVDSGGNIIFKDKRVSSVELRQRLKGIKSSGRKLTVFLRADGAVPYAKVIDVMKVIKAAGIKKISLITQEESS